MIGVWELLVVFLVILLLFGGKRLPELAKSLGEGIREFKKASSDIQSEIEESVKSEPIAKATKNTLGSTLESNSSSLVEGKQPNPKS